MVYCLLYTILHVAIIVASADAGLGLTVRARLIPLLHLVSREANDAAVGHPIAASRLDVVQWSGVVLPCFFFFRPNHARPVQLTPHLVFGAARDTCAVPELLRSCRRTLVVFGVELR